MEHKEPDGKLVPYCNLTEKPDASIETVQKAMQGDKEAFSALFMQTYRPMYLVVKSYLRRDEDIYDALQNGYTKAYKYLSRLQAPEAFFTWLKKTMENAARDIRADITGRESLHEDMEEFADELTVEYAESSERRADIQDVLSQLDPKQAEVLTLHYYDGMKASEIARLLDEPQSTIYSRLAAAKKVLIERLKVKGIDKSLYSGSVSAMIAVSLRTLIGTDVLSAATAQQMLDDILGGRQGHLGAAAYKLLEAQRNRAILRAVSLLMGLTVLVSCVTVALLNGIPWKWFSSLPAGLPGISSTPDAPENSAWGAPFHTTTGTDEESNASGSETQPGQMTTDTSVGEVGSTTSTSPDSTVIEPTVSTSSTTSTTLPPAAFVPDYRPGKANTEMRNPAWRATLFSTGREYLDWQDEWVYCFKDISGGYKFRRDGTGGRIPISVQDGGMAASMVWGDWVYYEDANLSKSWLKRIRTDGRVVETLVETPDNRFIAGFIRQDDRLLYAIKWYNAFGVEQFEYRAYTPATGKDERLPVSGNFVLYIPVGDWFFSPDNFCAYSFEYGEINLARLRTETEGPEAGNDWQTIKSEELGYFPVHILGDKLYTPTGHCIDFSGETPKVYQAVSLSGSQAKEETVFQVEFVDEARGRLAVTLYDDTGVYPRSMRWYSEKDGWGKELPAVLMRNSKYQTYQTSGDGTVFSTKADGTWFSCKLDGSDYREYIF